MREPFEPSQWKPISGWDAIGVREALREFGKNRMYVDETQKVWCEGHDGENEFYIGRVMRVCTK